MSAIRKPLDAAALVSAHITPEDRAAIVAARARFQRDITGSLINLRRLVKVRQTLNAATRVEDRQLVRGLDDEAAELMRDAGAVIDGLAQLDAQAGIKFDGDLVRLRNLLTETWRDYRDAKAAKPAKLRKAKPSGERVRLLRERRKRGVRHIVQIEISDADLAVLIEAKLLTEDEAADQKSVAEVVEQILPRLLRAQGRTYLIAITEQS